MGSESDDDSQTEGSEIEGEKPIPEDADTLKSKGNELYGKGRYDEALNLYSKAISKNPQNAQLYGNRSAALMMLKRYREVVNDCQKAVQLDSTFLKAYSRLSKAYFMMGDCPHSLETYQTALALGKNAEIEKEMRMVQRCQDAAKNCRASLDSNDSDKALSSSKLLMREAPDVVAFRLLHCETLIQCNKPDEASQTLADMMREDPTNHDVLCLRAKALSYIGLSFIPQAINHLRQTLELDPDHTVAQKLLKQCRRLEALRTEGSGFFTQKQWDQAADTYTTALEIDPRNKRLNAIWHCNRAAARKEQGRLQDAIADCTQAIELDETYLKAYQRRGRCYLAAEDFDNAVRDFEKVRTMDPSKENQNELKEAKLQQKRSKRKDYYKILGVSKEADEQEIKKAYREQALRHHPDKQAASSTEEERAKAEVQFKEIGEAYSVLSDSQKRRKYDISLARGDDYNDDDDDSPFSRGFGSHDASDLFDIIFGGGVPPMFFSGGGGGYGGGRGGPRPRRGGRPTHFAYGM